MEIIIKEDVITITFLNPQVKSYTIPAFQLREAIENYIEEKIDLNTSITAGGEQNNNHKDKTLEDYEKKIQAHGYPNDCPRVAVINNEITLIGGFVSSL
jgi:hypothetical protein